MAYRRSITARAKQFYQQQQHRVAPSFSHTTYRDDDIDRSDSSRNLNPSVPQFRSFGSGGSFGRLGGARNLFQDKRFAMPMGFAPSYARNLSNGSFGDGAAAENIDIFTDAIVEKSVEVAPVLNEIAAATADSFLPVAILQHAINYVHVYTGCDWWSSIVLATIMIRTLQVPLMLHQLKATSQFTLMRPKLEAVKAEMDDKAMSPSAVAEGQAKMKALFKEHGVTPFTPMKGILISAPLFCCLFFAVRNMAEKVPSFKDGGALWFTDLSTPDTMLILPVLTALTFWITVELNVQEGLEGNPTAGTIKNFSRIFAALTIPLTSTFPKAIFCYWITSNFFSLAYGLVIKRPAVKKFFNIPIITAPPVTSVSSGPKLGFFENIKRVAEAQAKAAALQQQSVGQTSLPSTTEETTKPASQRISSSSVLSQRIKSLEREVKGRKKGKKK